MDRPSADVVTTSVKTGAVDISVWLVDIRSLDVLAISVAISVCIC